MIKQITIFGAAVLLSCMSLENRQGEDMSINYTEIEGKMDASKIGVITQLSAAELAEAIQAKKYTSSEVCRAYFLQIKELNPKFNAIVTLNYKNALARAEKADEALGRGEIWGPLHGVPFTIKDTFSTAGIRSTAGYLPLKDHIPSENAVVVQRLLDAGAILMGKTNTPTLAMDMQTTNPIFGTTVNFYDAAWTAGGSSGGASVAVAARMTPFDIGTDLAGSIRLPAAFNGVYGLRPTFGLLSLRGHLPPKPGEIDGIRRMATAGPITHDISDLAFLLDIIGGPGKGDHRLDPIPPHTQKVESKKLKLAWATEFGGVPVSKEIKIAIEQFVDKLQTRGIQTTETQPKDFPYEMAWETWGAFVGAQGGYDQSNFVRGMGDFFTKSVVANTPMQRKIVGPITVPSYMEAMKNQDVCIELLESFLDNFDAWIVPVSSTTAFPHQKPTRAFGDFFVYETPIDVDGNAVPYYVATQSYTTIFSLTESPVVTIQIGKDSKGAPIGVQIVGRRFADHKLIQLAKILDEIKP